jgi:hypothetical protein
MKCCHDFAGSQLVVGGVGCCAGTAIEVVSRKPEVTAIRRFSI